MRRAPRAPHWSSLDSAAALLELEVAEFTQCIARGELWLATSFRATGAHGEEAGGCPQAFAWDSPGIWYLAPRDASAILAGGDELAVGEVSCLYTSNGPICAGLEGPNCSIEARPSYHGFTAEVEAELDALEARLCHWWCQQHPPGAAPGTAWWHHGDAPADVIGWVTLRRPLQLSAEDLFLPEEERAWWSLDGPGRQRTRKDPQRQAAAQARWRRTPRARRAQALAIARRCWSKCPAYRLTHVAEFIIEQLTVSGGPQIEFRTVRSWIEALAPAEARHTGRPPATAPRPSKRDLE